MTGPDGSSSAARPELLRSLTTAVLLDRSGDVRLAREARGATMEWGGVYAQHVRLTGEWSVVWEAPDGAHDLPGTRLDSSVDGDRFRSTHRAGELQVVQQITPLAEVPGAVRSLRFRSLGDRAVPVVVTSRFVPFLLPSLVEGIRPASFDVETRGDQLVVRQRGFALSFCSDLPPSRLYLGRASWLGGRRHGPVDEVGSDHELLVPPGGEAEIRFGLAGGLERELKRRLNGRAPGLPDPELLAGLGAAEEAAWIAATPELRFPEAPELEVAYRQARAGLRRLYSRPEDGMVGLVAGYPWYGAIWGRDLAWMLPALLWLGDWDWARASIDTILALQATNELPLVAAENGELPMQLSPGPIFLYGTSDTTLHYPTLAAKLERHSGLRPPASWQAPLERAMAWAERRTDPGTGLFRHGDEVGAIAQATAGLARVRYGIDAVDTTIWDSTDRRDRAIDLQVLWFQALQAARELYAGEADPTTIGRWSALAARLRSSIAERYAWVEEGYLVDTIREGVPVRRIRPNALRVVSAGLVSADVARSVVRRAAAADLTTPWGVRTLSASDKAYDPTTYHDGQVWTIATAWAADAAFAAGETDLGVGWLRTIAERFASEGGGANECYRGDRSEPYDSCFLLGLSVGPFLTVLFERLWGLSLDAGGPTLGVRPSFPGSWQRASLERLRLGDGVVSLRQRGAKLEVDWRGPRPLTVDGPDLRIVVPGGTVGELEIR